MQPSEGKVLFDGEDIVSVPPYKREINTVFQKYALFPHMDVYDNIAFGLRIAKVKEDEIDERVTEMLEIVSLKGFENRKVTSLSGGQQQRVAIARALVSKPAIVLADEPTGNLDSRTSADVLGLLQRTSREFNQTLVMITHNDAIAQLADRIVRIEDGKIVG